jgi:hypothetical protein
MLFDDKKLSSESIDDLLQCPVHTVEPFSLMLAPIYVLMKLNQKLVSVKAPLDFFLPDEIERLQRYEIFYVPKFVKSSVQFQTAARVIKNILQTDAEGLKPAPFEISHEIFSLMAPLWGKELKVEPFFMAIFAHELCEPLTPDQILWAREQAVVRHDQGLLLSGAFVFMAVQLGWFDYPALTQARNDIYLRTVKGEEWEDPKNELEAIVSGLNVLLSQDRSISKISLETMDDEWARKVGSRINRFVQTRGIPKQESPTIYGEGGFAA